MTNTTYIVTTDANDRYTFTANQPLTKSELAKLVWQREGKCADLEFYEETIQIFEVKPSL